MLTRRDWLRRSAFVSLAPMVPGFVERSARAAAPDRDGRILVVVHLDGGNDGINTVIPVGDELYAKYRTELRVKEADAIRVADGLALHPSMRAAADLIDRGRLAIVQGVGYPNPDRSHFESLKIWQAGRRDVDAVSTGWLGRALDEVPDPIGPDLVHVGDEGLPRALIARRAVASSFADASDLSLELPTLASETGKGDDLSAFVGRAVTGAYASAARLEAAVAAGGPRYPETELARRLSLVARSIKADAPARVYYAIQTGYDTHSVQAPTHARLLREFAGAVKAFCDDLEASKLDDRVVLLAFSEFGRRPEENGSHGTDHGAAGPVFLAGRAARAGLVGTTPRLGELVDGDLKASVDFRGVYATLLDDWLGLPADAILGGRFDRAEVLAASIKAS